MYDSMNEEGTHNLGDSPGAELLLQGKTLENGQMYRYTYHYRAETVGETVSKGTALVANDWVKGWSLRVCMIPTRLNVQSSLTQVRVTPSTRVSRV